MNRLPVDLLQDILRLLGASKSLGSLACFLRCNHFTYAITLPILYCHIELDHQASFEPFFRGLVLPNHAPRESSRPVASRSNALWPEVPLELDSTNARLSTAVQEVPPEYQATTASHRRKVQALSFTQSLSLKSIPPYDLFQRLCHFVHTNKHRMLFPCVLHVHLGDEPIWDVLDWHNAISVESRAAVHPFVRFLTYAVHPRSVVVNLPTMTVERKPDWWNVRYGSREVVDVVDDERKVVMESAWKRFTTKGIDRPLGILFQVWRPHRLVLGNVVVSRGIAIPGRTTRLGFAPCQCQVLGLARCEDHTTPRERVRSILSMCGKVIKAGPTSKKTRIELIGAGSGNKVEEEEIRLNVIARMLEQGWADKIDLVFIAQNAVRAML